MITEIRYKGVTKKDGNTMFRIIYEKYDLKIGTVIMRDYETENRNEFEDTFERLMKEELTKVKGGYMYNQEHKEWFRIKPL
jgi:hypothetical protein